MAVYSNKPIGVIANEDVPVWIMGKVGSARVQGTHCRLCHGNEKKLIYSASL